MLKSFSKLSVLSLNDNGISGFDEESLETLNSLAMVASLTELQLNSNAIDLGSLPITIQHILIHDLED